jgi:hypothetical protein
MRDGQDNARTDDTATMKKTVIDMLREFDEPATRLLTARHKHNQGFYHPLTGRLLCPAKLDWEDEEYVSFLASIRN